MDNVNITCVHKKVQYDQHCQYNINVYNINVYNVCNVCNVCNVYNVCVVYRLNDLVNIAVVDL